MDEFALDDDGAGADDGGGFVADDQDVVGVVAGGDEVVAGIEFGGGGFADGGEDAEGGEEACSRRGALAWFAVHEGGYVRGYQDTRRGEKVIHTAVVITPPQRSDGIPFWQQCGNFRRNQRGGEQRDLVLMVRDGGRGDSILFHHINLRRWN